MCAEYVPGSVIELRDLFLGLAEIHPLIRGELEGRVFPHSEGYFLYVESNDYRLVSGEFGLIPSWWSPERDLTKAGKPRSRPGFATYNARLESIVEKKSFSEPFRNRHCIIPIKSFFESSYFGDKFAGTRVRIESGSVLLAAGIYSEWMDRKTGEVIKSFSVITHRPPQQIFEVGHDRCPIFFEAERALEWVRQVRGGADSMKFCLTHNRAAELEFEAQLDRPLAAGWERRAPSAEEIRAIEVLK